MAASIASSFDAQERAYYDRLFSVVDKDDAGVLPGQDALPFLVSSGLSQILLGEVWALADPDNNGFLTKEGWYKAARLIGWLQKGGKSTVDESLISQRGPYPTFAGQAPPPPPASPSPSTSTVPPITPADRTKFTRLFVGCSPSNGLVSGDKARDAFVKSKLDYDKLGQIWNLADTQQRGSLDLTDFVIGMHLIQSCMADPSLTLPATLPPGTYEQASGGRPAPLTPQRTGASLRPQHTGPMSPQRTGTPRSAVAWDVTPEAKAASDRFFAELDKGNIGVIDGDVAVPFMLQSQLDEGTLATIWDLADMKHEGRLDRDQFAVAMHLINTKLAGGEVPSTLPQSLVPPPLRGTLGTQEVLNGPSNAARDLFDLFDDTPISPLKSPASPPPSTRLPPPPSRKDTRDSTRSAAPTPKPPVSLPTPLASNDLLGDESSSINDNSAQIGMKRNELENTSRSLSQLTQNRGSLESTATESKAQLDELEAKLADAKAKHEIESKLVAELRTRVAEQSTQLRTIEADVIAAESDVSALKSEKTELEQALLRDKEEIRGLQRMMKEVEEEKTSLKNILEKLRKEARQQKGMVTIAKKQLATAETSRDAVQKEVDAEAVAAAAVPLPATPQALSPVPTGLSQRSNNPFDRLNRASSGVSVSSPPASEPSGVAILGAGAGAALGLVAAGAETLFHAAKDAVSPASEDEDEVKTEKEDVTPGSDVHATANPPPSDEVRSDSAVGRVADDAQATSRETSAGGPSDFIGDIGTPAPDPTEDAHEPEADLGHPPTDPELSQSPHVAGHGTTEAAMEAQPAPAGLSLDVEHRDPFEAERAAEHDPFGVPPSSSAVNPASGTSSGFDDSFGQTAPEHAASSGAHDDFDAMFSDLGEANPETRGETSLAPGKDHVADRGDDSSDEDDGPEDLEAPARYQSPPPASTTTAIPLARRSAPPPPSRGATAPTTDGFDPFASAEAQPGPKLGQERQLEPNLDIAMSENAKSSDPAPAQNSAPPLPSVPTKQSAKTASFDDDDFDFSDLPPAQVEQSAHHTGVPVNQGAFDDEFAGFDDEFGPSQPPSDGSVTKSYEIVSPGPRDEWGSNGPGQAPPSQMSFDDAFGGDFAPVPSSSQPASLAAPPLPQRKDSSAQADDIEDVKKLCAMGFSRTLVIAALDANGYDFQKALNVLLAQ